MPSLPDPEIRDLPIQPATAAALAPFGTLIEPGEDGTPFGPADAQLDLGRGTPRFYTMRLQHKPLQVRHITRHRSVTQVLASAGGQPWVIVLAPPLDPDRADAEPAPAAIRAFRIAGHQALALARGTWHAGPLFDTPQADFFNLELADTNSVDHHSCDLRDRFGLLLRLVG